MATFGKKSNYTDWLYSRPAIAILAVLVLFTATAVFERFKVERQMYARRAAAEQELQAAAERKESIKEQVEYLEGERGIEEEIRKHFDVAREGETVIILMGEDPEASTGEEGTPPPPPKWYEFWQ